MLISEFIEKNFPKTLILPEVDENSNADLFYEGGGRWVNAEWYYENALNAIKHALYSAKGELERDKDTVKH
jgi:hypothetical protein